MNIDLIIYGFGEHEKGRPLPKFGEWDVNNPASADGFTVIFAKARDEKKAKGTAATSAPTPNSETPMTNQSYENNSKSMHICGNAMGNDQIRMTSNRCFSALLMHLGHIVCQVSI
ncbi:rpm1-interacting protein 4 [Phtheirospermum japonicum]|uniref:Rpm1-interacting protein 4 n=1 Tax=Phtheirospermum japonicum TaxID=374723 RepID=A0A830BM81_9LAMI|nr:rpm1-interacting protein 4 [Phtheirospermum japonicum]